MALVPVIVVAWAGLSLVLLLFSELPVATLLPLAVLAAGFEAVHALHVGVERIGRYLQVFYEETSGYGTVSPPRWETTATEAGPRLPGGGVDPLFSLLFSVAVIVNLATSFVPGPTSVEVSVLGGVHLVLLIRIVRARMAAARQRAKDLAHYRAVRDAGRA